MSCVFNFFSAKKQQQNKNFQKVNKKHTEVILFAFDPERKFVFNLEIIHLYTP